MLDSLFGGFDRRWSVDSGSSGAVEAAVDSLPALVKRISECLIDVGREISNLAKQNLRREAFRGKRNTHNVVAAE